MISINEVSGPSARNAFAKAEPFIDAALRASFSVYTIHDLWQMVTAATPSAKLLMIYSDSNLKGAAITRVSNYSSCSVFEVVALGGSDMAEWFPVFHGRLEEIAARDGCRFMAESGRDGWGRFLKNYGWRPAPRTMYKELS